MCICSFKSAHEKFHTLGAVWRAALILGVGQGTHYISILRRAPSPPRKRVELANARSFKQSNKKAPKRRLIA